MVYVDPEPEIGSAAPPAGSSNQRRGWLDMPRGGRVDAAGPSNSCDAVATDAAVEGLMKEVGSLTSDAAATVVDEPTPVPDSTQAGSDIGGEAAEPRSSPRLATDRPTTSRRRHDRRDG